MVEDQQLLAVTVEAAQVAEQRAGNLDGGEHGDGPVVAGEATGELGGSLGIEFAVGGDQDVHSYPFVSGGWAAPA